MIFDCRSNVTGMLIRLLLERMTDSALTGCFIKQRELRGEKRVGLEPTKSKHSLSAASNVKQFSLLSLSVRWSLGCSSARLHEFSCMFIWWGREERGEESKKRGRLSPRVPDRRESHFFPRIFPQLREIGNDDVGPWTMSKDASTSILWVIFYCKWSQMINMKYRFTCDKFERVWLGLNNF